MEASLEALPLRHAADKDVGASHMLSCADGLPLEDVGVAVELPVNLQRWVQARGADVEGLREWVLDLPTVVEGLAARWSLDLGPPVQPGGIASWTAPVRAADDRRLVLKVG